MKAPFSLSVILSCLFAILLPRSAAAQQGVLRLSVDQVVDRAVTKGLEISENQAEVDAAVAAQKAARALYGPRVLVSGKALYFNETPTFTLDFDTSSVPPEYQQLVAAMLPSGPMEAGEQYTVDFSVSIAQPLTRLEAIHELNVVKQLGVRIAETHGDGARVKVAHEARESFYILLKVREGVKALAETELEILARQEQVKAFRDAELIGPEQALEVAVKLAEIRQQLIQTRALEKVATSRLRLVARLDRGQEIDLVEPEVLPDLPALNACIEAAQGSRTELVELGLTKRQAEAGVRAKVQEFLPEVNLVGSYQYQAGTTFGQPALAVGAMLSWTPFAWGETHYAVQEARANVRRAGLALERVEELIGLDVERAYAEALAAQESIGVTQIQLEQAEELYRIERVRFENHVNTATDLLSAQTSLLRARIQQKSIRYDYLIALSALRRAMGEQ